MIQDHNRLYANKSGQSAKTLIHKKWIRHVRIQVNKVTTGVIRVVDDGKNNIHYSMKNYHYHNKYLPARKEEMNVSQPGFSPFFMRCFHMGYDSAA